MPNVASSKDKKKTVRIFVNKGYVLGLMLSAISAPSLAQSTGGDNRGLPVPNHSAVDANGVDLGSGRFQLSLNGPDIGPDDIGLHTIWYYVIEGGNNNWTMYINSDGAWGDSHQAISQYTVSVEGTTDEFHQSGGVMSLYSGRGGETLATTFGPFTDRDGTIYHFGPAGYLSAEFVSEIDKPDGEVIKFYYKTASNGGSVLVSVVDNAGYMIHAENGVWTASNLAVDYCDPTASHCTYSRQWPAMTRGSNYYQDELGHKTTVTASGLTASVTFPSGKKTSIIYGSGGSPQLADAGHVVSLNDGQHTWTYSWTWDPNVNPLYNRVVTFSRKNPDGTTLSGHSIFGSPTDETDELTRTTSYGVYRAAPYLGQIVSVAYPEGGSVDFGYDQNNRGNLPEVDTVSKDGSQTLKVKQTFPSTCVNVNICNLPTASFDALNHETDYTYYDWGGIKSELGPPVNGVRPLKRYFYSQLYAYVKNASGTLVRADTPIWRLTQEIACRAATNSAGTDCGSSADEIITNYEYGAPGTVNALLVHAKVDDVGGAAARTCYAYDPVGNLIAKTLPRAGLTSCS